MKNRFRELKNEFAWLTGNFLVASPTLAGTPFERTVVFVLQTNDAGVFGVILNRPANSTLKQSWAVASGATPEEADHLCQGGPVGGPVFALHPIESLAEFTVEPGVFISSNQEIIDKVVHSGDHRYRIFCGVAGWNHSQLREELAKGNWYPLDGDKQLVFGPQEIAWERLVLQYGERILCDILGKQRLPGNPLDN